jgi:hypothetical protein
MWSGFLPAPDLDDDKEEEDRERELGGKRWRRRR